MNAEHNHPGVTFLVLLLALGMSFIFTLLPLWLLVLGFVHILVAGWICALWNRSRSLNHRPGTKYL